jgi:hypothetical protein
MLCTVDTLRYKYSASPMLNSQFSASTNISLYKYFASPMLNSQLFARIPFSQADPEHENTGRHA